MRFYFLIFVAAFLLRDFAAAQDASFAARDGEGLRIEDHASRKTSDDFRAKLLLTSDLDIYTKWPKSRRTKISETKTIAIGRRLIPVLLFANPKKDIDDTVDVTYDVIIRRPDGKSSLEARDLLAMNKRIDALGPNIQLAKSHIEWSATNEDPLGEWQFEVTVFDKNQNVKLELVSKCIVQDLPPDPVKWTDVEMFYKHPSSYDFKRINRLFNSNCEFIPHDDRMIVAAVFLAKAHLKYGYSIEGKNTATHLARAIVAQETSDCTAAFILDDDKLSVTKIDVWWGSFYATGEERYLELILKQSGDLECAIDKMLLLDLDGEVNIDYMGITRAANMSFKFKCATHESIREFANRAINDPAWTEQHSFLYECLGKPNPLGTLDAQRIRDPQRFPDTRK